MKIQILIIVIAAVSCKSPDRKNYLLIKGGTIINIAPNGDKIDELSDAYVLIKDGTIIETGKLTKNNSIPDNTEVLDAAGKYIFPGLTDGFAVINNQEYANAYLYMGVTSLIGVDGGRRGKFFHEADPSPNVYMLESVGDDMKTTAEHITDLEHLFKNGFRVALLKYALTPDHVKELKQKADELNMACIGELGHTTYKQGIEAGLKAFVHTTRYSLDVAPPEMAKAVADEPFSDKMDSPKWKYYQYLYSLKEDDPALLEHARILGNSGVFLMPTLSLLYLDLPEHKNPWDYPVAKIIDAKDIDNPANKITSKHNYDSLVQANYTALAIKEFMIEQTYHKAGAGYLAGSATDVWGTMPGISLHTELESLKKIGLTNEEVLAAATSNFNEAFKWKIGEIEKGFAANILLLNHNPLTDIKNLRDFDILILNGKIIERKSLLRK